jgi:hypothetical protein
MLGDYALRYWTNDLSGKPGEFDFEDYLISTSTEFYYKWDSDDGENYDSLNLGSEFQEEGLRIRFEAKLHDDISSVHMWGKVIEITKIEKLEGG